MKVTVVVAVHNCERYIGRCLRSLLDQSFPRREMEVVVVDDGSTDNTRRVLETFGDWIRVVRLEEQQGLPSACNAGIRAALSRYVVRVDADDYVHEDFVRLLYLYLSLNPQYNAVACDYYVVDEREEIVGRKNATTDPIACGVMFKKDDLIELGLYDEGFMVHEDRDLRLRFEARYSQVVRVELPLYRYRRHESNMTNQTERGKKYTKMLEQRHGSQQPAVVQPPAQGVH